MRRAPLSAGVALLACGVVWQFQLTQRWTQRLPPGWRITSHYVGTATYPDPKTGRLPEGGQLAKYDRSQRLSSEAGRPRWVELEDRYSVRDAATGHVVFDYTTRDTVDPRTGAHLEVRYRGDVALFPRDVERRPYRLRTNYVTSIPLTFEREDELEGLPTYLFSYRGRLESTASYTASTGDLGGLRAPPGQEVRCLDDQFYYRIWVEPSTGEQVKLEEGCPSGDYLHDVASGRPVTALSRWTGVSAGDDLIERIAEVRRERLRYLWASRYLGLVLLGSAVGLAAAGLSRRTTPPP
jgi:Porin PorA